MVKANSSNAAATRSCSCQASAPSSEAIVLSCPAVDPGVVESDREALAGPPKLEAAPFATDALSRPVGPDHDGVVCFGTRPHRAFGRFPIDAVFVHCEHTRHDPQNATEADVGRLV